MGCQGYWRGVEHVQCSEWVLFTQHEEDTMYTYV